MWGRCARVPNNWKACAVICSVHIRICSHLRESSLGPIPKWDQPDSLLVSKTGICYSRCRFVIGHQAMYNVYISILLIALLTYYYV